MISSLISESCTLLYITCMRAKWCVYIWVCGNWKIFKLKNFFVCTILPLFSRPPSHLLDHPTSFLLLSLQSYFSCNVCTLCTININQRSCVGSTTTALIACQKRNLTITVCHSVWKSTCADFNVLVDVVESVYWVQFEFSFLRVVWKIISQQHYSFSMSKMIAEFNKS